MRLKMALLLASERVGAADAHVDDLDANVFASSFVSSRMIRICSAR